MKWASVKAFLVKSWKWVIAVIGGIFLFILVNKEKKQDIASAVADHEVERLKEQAEKNKEEIREGLDEASQLGDESLEAREEAENILAKPDPILDEDDPDQQDEIDELIDNARRDR